MEDKNIKRLVDIYYLITAVVDSTAVTSSGYTGMWRIKRLVEEEIIDTMPKGYIVKEALKYLEKNGGAI